jgi:hypothetical protein
MASDDGGSTWIDVGATGLPNGGWITWLGGLGQGHLAALVPIGPSELDGQALFVSPDGGRTWASAALGA